MTDREASLRQLSSDTQDEFFAYYAQASQSPAALRRFRAQRDALLHLAQESPEAPLTIVDLGCGAGSASLLWGEAGHRAIGIDVSEKLVRLAMQRADDTEFDLRFAVASAHQLPLPDACAEICVAPELLEHVPDWESCVREIARVLKPGGLTFISTTNTLCPKQQEFTLPLFSWYPRRLKARYIELAQTTRPELANYASYPAFHWFNFYFLRRYLRDMGFDRFWTRFDLMAKTSGSSKKRIAAKLVNSLPPTRLLGQILNPGTQIYARMKR